MFCKSRKTELTAEIERDPEKYSAWVISSIGSKADKYKKWSRRYGLVSVLLSLLVVFVLMLEGVSRVTIAASLISITNSVLLAWFQLEKPYDRWRLYRKYHRLVEAERVRFLNHIPPYDTSTRGKLLIEELSNIQVLLHYEWDGLIPSNEDVKKLQAKKE